MAATMKQADLSLIPELLKHREGSKMLSTLHKIADEGGGTKDILCPHAEIGFGGVIYFNWKRSTKVCLCAICFTKLESFVRHHVIGGYTHNQFKKQKLFKVRF